MPELIKLRDAAQQLNCSYEKARQLIKDEPGVVIFKKGNRNMYRIPESVLERIVRRSSNPTK